MGQMPYKPDGVRVREGSAFGRLRLSRRRVERGEQRILDQHAGAGQAVKQARLARVRVARDRDTWNGVSPSVRPLRVAYRLHRGDLAPQACDARPDPAAVCLQLRLTRSTSAD